MQMPPPLPPTRREGSTLSSAPRKNEEHGDELADLPEWVNYFDSRSFLEIENEGYNRFRVYEAGDSGPLLVFLHGAGHTSLSWALLVEKIKSKARVLAYDCRGHGETECVCGQNLCANVLTEDGVKIVNRISNSVELKTGGGPPGVVLVGHSMGGAIATRMAATGEVKNLKGLIILDVAEGSAIKSLPYMKEVIMRIPTHFQSIGSAISWSLRSRTLLNPTSAKLSIPSQLVKKDGIWVWRLRLMNSEPYWRGWYQGMTKMFLEKRIPKLLVCAGNDRLDIELTIAHMQGKFQLKILGACGHVVQEDNPNELAKVILEFISRYSFA